MILDRARVGSVVLLTLPGAVAGQTLVGGE